jgi:pyruvate dehydrogenase E2 component (dihydrolipoamide acetyltransferase)
MGTKREILVPDIGDFEDVEVIEVLVGAGDAIEVEASLVTLESDKATLEVPSPYAGSVLEVRVAEGDRVSEGSVLLVLDAETDAQSGTETETQRETGSESESAGAVVQSSAASPAVASAAAASSSEPVAIPRPTRSASRGHASPSVRRFARELGVDPALVSGSGRKGRILKSDVQAFVKQALAGGVATALPDTVVQFEAPKEIDFARFGEIEIAPLARIRRLSAANLHRSWVTVPHVTQHDEADITELEAFRKQQRSEAEARGVKLTPLAFLMKAVASVLGEYPEFASSLDPTGENLILKRYTHIGVAVDTPNGLVVPVLRDVDEKDVYEIALALADVSERARIRRLRPADLEGACFSISSLGGIGGTAFTPIVNSPEVAILGVSRHRWQPVYSDGEFVPRLMLPLSLSYDHRVIDGAAAVRFTTRLAAVLADVDRLRGGQADS